MKKGFRFELCPQCDKQGVYLLLLRVMGDLFACKYCGWYFDEGDI